MNEEFGDERIIAPLPATDTTACKTPSPTPMVGAVIVAADGKRMISKGYHALWRGTCRGEHFRVGQLEDEPLLSEAAVLREP